MATLLLIVIYLAFISLGLPDSLLGVSWPLIQTELSVPLSFAGGISMVISCGTIISSLFSSKIIARFGTGKVTLISVLLTAISLLGFSIAPSYIWFIICAFPLGLGAGSVDAGLNEYVAEHYESRHMSWLHCFWGIGAVTGPLIMSRIIAQSTQWRSGYSIVSLIQAAVVVILIISLPLWNKMHKNIHKENPSQHEHDKDMTNQSFFSPLSIKGVKLALATFFCYAGIEYTMGLWGSSFLIYAKKIDKSTAALWVSAFYGSITLGRFITGFITVKFTNRQLIRIGQIIIFSGIILLLLPISGYFVLGGFVLLGFGCAPIFPCMLHETPVRFGIKQAQSVMGFQMVMAYVGTITLPPLFGVIASKTTLALLPVFLLIYCSIMIISSEKIPKKLIQ